MSQYGRRVSRSLIVVLVLVLGIGLALHYNKVSTTRASEAIKPTASTAAEPVAPVAMVAATPATKPATQEVALVAETPTTAPAVNVSAVIAAAKEKAEIDLLGARDMLNDALVSGGASELEQQDLKKQIADLNQTIIFSTQPFTKDPYGGTYVVQPGDKLQKIAFDHEIPWELLLKINSMSDARRLRSGQKLKIINGPINVVVTKSKFMMDLWLGDPEKKGGMYVMSFPVGLGRDDSTPTGIWMAEAGRKIKDPTYYSPRGEGVKEANDPQNPLGHRWIGLTGTSGQAVGKMSYGIHGTIDENSIGKQESMGCIRMHNADVAQVFDMLVDGKTIVVVKG